MIIYRTDGAWGSGLGSNLSAAQVDGNFYDLDQRVATIEAGVAATVNQIASISVVGSQMLITMEDASTFGPFTLPVAILHWRGEWEVDTDYAELDLVYVTGEGVYLVLVDHTSDPYSFDEGAVNEESAPLYFKIFGEITTLVQHSDFPNSYVSFGGYELRVTDDELGVGFFQREHLIKVWKDTEGVAFSADQLLYREVITERTVMPEAVPLIKGWLGVQATSLLIISMQKNGVEFGTISVDASSNDSFSAFMSGGDETFVPGDYFDLVAPNSPDATAADLAVTLPCYRTII